MRSPLFKLDSGAPAPAQPRRDHSSDRKALAKPQQRVELSAEELSTFNDDGNQTRATSLSPLLFTTTERRPGGYALKISFLLVSLALATWFLFPEWAEPAGHYWRKLQASILFKKAVDALPTSERVSTFEENSGARLSKKQLAALLNTTDCRQAKQLLESYDNKPKKLAEQTKTRINAAECLLAINSPQAATEILRPLKALIVKTPETSLNRQKTSRDLAEAQYLLMMALVRSGNNQEANAVIGSHCKRWQASNTCVAKLLNLSHQNNFNQVLASDKKSLVSLLKTRGQLTGKAESRLWYAGALIALREDRQSIVDQRLTLALRAAPREAHYLRKEIYDAQAREFFFQGEHDKLLALLDSARHDLASLNKQAKVNLIVLDEIVHAQDHKLTLLRLLRRDDLREVATRTPELLNILGVQALRWQMTEEFLDFIRRSRDRISLDDSLAKSNLGRLSLWEVRAMIGLAHYEKALDLIESHVRNFGHTATSYHLRGIAELSANPSPESAQIAGESFAKAASGTNSWESRYAQGIALTRSGQTAQVGELRASMERDLRSPRERYWIDMLIAEWYLATEQPAAAVKILRKWANKEATYALPRQLIVDGLTKMGNKTAADAQDRELNELRERFPGGLTPDLLASPLGALAYERRPIK